MESLVPINTFITYGYYKKCSSDQIRKLWLDYLAKAIDSGVRLFCAKYDCYYLPEIVRSPLEREIYIREMGTTSLSNAHLLKLNILNDLKICNPMHLYVSITLEQFTRFERRGWLGLTDFNTQRECYMHPNFFEKFLRLLIVTYKELSLGCINLTDGESAEDVTYINHYLSEMYKYYEL